MFTRRSGRRRRSSRSQFAQRRWGSPVERVFDAKRGYARRLGMEMLEDRRMLAIVWINQGDANNDTDSFGAIYGGLAAVARQNINRAIDDWNQVIIDFNYDGDNNPATDNVFELTVIAADLGGGSRGLASNVVTDGNGLPVSGMVTMDDDGGGNGWFIDPRPFGDDEFLEIVNPFQANSVQAGNDFFRTVVHEIGHLMGIGSTASLAIHNFLTPAGTDQVSGADDLNVFQNLAGQFGIEVTLTDNGGLHVYEGPVDPAFPLAPVHPNDLMNPGRTVGPPATRQLITDLNVMLLADAYGYSVALPSTLGMVFIGPDGLEDNSTQQTATVLGSLEQVTVQDLSIFDSDDEDWFQITAAHSGMMIFNVYFAHFANNDLDIEVYDVAGNNITPTGQGNSTTDNEQIIIPVVSQERYYLRVFGVNDSINNYDLEIENYAAPTPNTVFLHPLDDTGVFNNDNVTTVTTPRFFIGTDLFNFEAMGIPIDPPPGSPGADVELQIFGTNTGTFQTINATRINEALWSANVVAPLPADLYLVQAATRIRDAANPSATGRTQLSAPLWVTVETTGPPVSFGLPGVSGDGMFALSDTGVVTDPATSADRITSDTSPRFWGLAEAQSTVRLYVDVNGNNQVDAGDVFIGQTTATPFGENPEFADGYWEIQSVLDLNNIPGLPRDGERRLLVTAEDYVGNITTPSGVVFDTNLGLRIFLDTQGPVIEGISIPGHPDFDLFDPKPSQNGPTPLVNSLVIDITDNPDRLAPEFLYDAIVADIASSPGNYLLVGEHLGIVPIDDVIVTLDPPADGMPATATIELVFAQPLADDRYTLTIRDAIVDPAGNRLDGESNAAEPQAPPQFPTGNEVPGGDFVARFTIDSRPEIGTYVSTNINIDINGNWIWDPAPGLGGDFTNVDISFTLPVQNADGTIGLGGFNVHDLLFAGEFFDGPRTSPRHFDQLAAFGYSAELGAFRWLVDFDSDGVITVGSDILTIQPAVVNGFNVASAIPVAGNFGPDGRAVVGLYNAGVWAFDTNGNFIIDAGDLFISTPQLLGYPIVGDFDGDGTVDLATFNNNTFRFDLGHNGYGQVDDTFVWGFPGVLDRPVAADMDGDGITDVGLFVPRSDASHPNGVADWYFLISDDHDETRRQTGTVNTLNHAFTPVPFGVDLFAQFGNQQSLPIVGNFDPPVAAPAQTPTPGHVPNADQNGDGIVDGFDFLAWQRAASQSSPSVTDAEFLGIWQSEFGTTNILQSTAVPGQESDLNGDGLVDGFDFLAWQREQSTPLEAWEVEFGHTAPILAALSSASAEEEAALAASYWLAQPIEPVRVDDEALDSSSLPTATFDNAFAELAPDFENWDDEDDWYDELGDEPDGDDSHSIEDLAFASVGAAV